MKRPDLAHVPQFYHKYINLAAGDDVIRLLHQSKTTIPDFLDTIPEDKWPFRYAAGKWSIKELVQHMMDSERIFAYRALCIARGEAASLPGFNENEYAALSKADQRTKQRLLQELRTVQESTALLYESFDDEQLDRSGIANNNPISVRAIGFIIAGHLLHHRNVLQEKYLL